MGDLIVSVGVVFKQGLGSRLTLGLTKGMIA
jgi:hypothetical protein